MRIRTRIPRTGLTTVAAVAVALGVAGVTAAPGQARPMPPGGSSAVMVITNRTGMPLQLSNFPDTAVGGGSSMDVRWIDAPPANLAPDQTTIVRAWTSNTADMGVDVTYSYTYRFNTVTYYHSSLGHILGFTNYVGTKASPGESVNVTVIRPGPAMMANYVLS